MDLQGCYYATTCSVVCRYLLSQNSAIRRKLQEISDKAGDDAMKQDALYQKSVALQKAASDWEVYEDAKASDKTASKAKLLQYLKEQGTHMDRFGFCFYKQHSIHV